MIHSVHGGAGLGSAAAARVLLQLLLVLEQAVAVRARQWPAAVCTGGAHCLRAAAAAALLPPQAHGQAGGRELIGLESLSGRTGDPLGF